VADPVDELPSRRDFLRRLTERLNESVAGIAPSGDKAPADSPSSYRRPGADHRPDAARRDR
jgi:hypothetical protein